MPSSPTSAVLSALAIAMATATVAKGMKQRKGNRKSKRRQQLSRERTADCVNATETAPSEPEVLLSKLFGDKGRMYITVDAGGHDCDSSSKTAADEDTFSALMHLLVLLLSVAATICCFSYAVAVGSFVLAAGSVPTGTYFAAPAATAVRKFWGRTLDEALDESINTTSVPWDLAVI